MKRKISGFLVVVFAFLMMSVTSTAMAANFEVSISYFENYAADGDTLSADKREDVSVLPGSNAALTESGLTVSGQGEKGKAFDVSVSIESGAFVNPRDWNENYDVLSVLDLESFVRFVLKEKDANNMLYVDVRFSGEAGKRESYENYNTNWYTAFVSSDVVLEEEVALPGVRDTTSSTRRSYSTTNNIYGDIYKEYIQIEAIADYPSVINNQTGGLFCFTLGIKDKWTVYGPFLRFIFNFFAPKRLSSHAGIILAISPANGIIIPLPVPPTTHKILPYETH